MWELAVVGKQVNIDNFKKKAAEFNRQPFFVLFFLTFDKLNGWLIVVCRC